MPSHESEKPPTPEEVEQAINTLNAAAEHSEGMSQALFKDAKSNLVGESYPLCGELVTDD